MSGEPSHQPAAGRSRWRIVVLGGYGAVGQSVVSRLAATEHHVIVAGRSDRRAGTLAARLGGNVTAAAVDVTDLRRLRDLTIDADAVVMCLDRNNVEVARHCLERGIRYVDVTATPSIVDGIKRLDETARRNRVAAAISVGLAPGISNVIARRAASSVCQPLDVSITLLFGLAGDNGPDSRRWIIDGLRTRRSAPSRIVDLVGVGRRRAFGFPFSDQFTMTTELEVPVTTRLAFESRTVTSMLFRLRDVGVFSMLHRLGADELVGRTSQLVRRGTDRFIIQADAQGAAGEAATVAVFGRGECVATGEIAAETVLMLLNSAVAPGVHHLDELVGVDQIATLAKLRFEELRRDPWPSGASFRSS